MRVMLKRAYEPPSEADGVRILVDRLWPRGVSKVELRLGIWLKDIAPSTELRKWFGHDPDKWQESKTRYRAELKDNPALAELRECLHKGCITLVCGAKDQVHNGAVVLSEVLVRKTKTEPPGVRHLKSGIWS